MKGEIGLNAAFIKLKQNGLNRLKLFWALSRTPHALIDIANPALAAVLCIGTIPAASITIIGLITAFAGYTAVYALNDVVDYKIDREKVNIGGYDDSQEWLDGVLIRHPMAKGVLNFYEGVLWVLFWAVLALIGAYILNPVCMIIFLMGCILEAIYCLLLKVTPLRAMINGLVKACGAAAAVFAVNPNPPILFFIILILWIFFWEIGGQNIPNDLNDLEEDRHFNAKTIPVALGLDRATLISVVSLMISFFLSFLLLILSHLSFHAFAY